MDDRRVVFERDLRALDAAGALDVNQRGTVHHHLGDGWIVKKRLKRPEADDRICDVPDERAQLRRRNGQMLFAEQPRNRFPDADPTLPSRRDVHDGGLLGE